MKKAWLAAAVVFGMLLTGCNGADGSGGAGSGDSEERTGSAEKARGGTEEKGIAVLTQEDVELVPRAEKLSYNGAVAAGGEVTASALGVFGGSPVIWYTVNVAGVEYYFYSFLHDSEAGKVEQEAAGWAAVGGEYALKCGISVGDPVEEVLEEYPDMAVSGLEGGKGGGYLEEYGCWDFHAGGYPDGWQEAFDCALLAEVAREEELPEYLGLMAKDGRIAAITVFYPTAG